MTGCDPEKSFVFKNITEITSHVADDIWPAEFTYIAQLTTYYLLISFWRLIQKQMKLKWFVQHHADVQNSNSW